MFCPHCGKELNENAAVCLNCGRYVSEVTKSRPADSASAGWWWLGFFVPIAGLIIWAVCNDSTPIKAKKAGIGALVGFITSIVLVILLYVLIFAFSFMVGMNIAYM